MSSTLPSIPSQASKVAQDVTKRHLQSTIKRVADLINIAKRPVIYADRGVISTPEVPNFSRSSQTRRPSLSQPPFKALEDTTKRFFTCSACMERHMPTWLCKKQILWLIWEHDSMAVWPGVLRNSHPQAKAAVVEGRGGIVHFEIMPKNINKVVQATEAVEGDVVANLTHLVPQVEGRSMTERKEWFDKIRYWKEKFPSRQIRSHQTPNSHRGALESHPPPERRYNYRHWCWAKSNVDSAAFLLEAS